jgi:hypothetical protein
LRFVCTVRANSINPRYENAMIKLLRASFELDVLNESDVQLPGKIADLIRQIDHRVHGRCKPIKETEASRVTGAQTQLPSTIGAALKHAMLWFNRRNSRPSRSRVEVVPAAGQCPLEFQNQAT